MRRKHAFQVPSWEEGAHVPLAQAGAPHDEWRRHHLTSSQKTASPMGQRRLEECAGGHCDDLASMNLECREQVGFDGNPVCTLREEAQFGVMHCPSPVEHWGPGIFFI
ncbi:hypothetical protein [Corallococcus aberystwythensis]|uniref:hypothetical protein n=1 Tax=Corallococcus aberystwythensis TaxID=2316722 RepID=UPI0011C471BF|nr:hypothetical protein [Corallococcus aberystwythensis]